MTVIKQSGFEFDVNQFVRDLLKSTGRARYARMLHAFFDFDNVAVRPTEEYDGPTNEKELADKTDELVQKGKAADANVVTHLYMAYKYPTGSIAEDMRKTWHFINPLFYSDEYFSTRFHASDFTLLLKKLDVFNERVQFDILKHLFSRVPEKQTDVFDIICTKIINNSYATNDDKVHAALFLSYKNHDVVRDVIEDLTKELEAELQGKIPDVTKIKHIGDYAAWLMDRAEGHLDKNPKNIQNPLDPEYIKMIREEFDIENIKNADEKYVAQNRITLEERAISAEKRAAEAEKLATKYTETNVRLNKLEMEYNSVRRFLEAEKRKNEHLTNQLNVLNRQIEQQNSFIKTIKMKIASMKTGMFNGGAVKDLQQFIQNR